VKIGKTEDVNLPIIYIHAGLGNQLFQLAAANVLCEDGNYLIDISSFNNTEDFLSKFSLNNKNKQESFYFVQDVSSGNYSLCNTRVPLCNFSPELCPVSERLTKAPIFKSDNNFFSLISSSTNRYKGVTYNFYIPNTDLEMKFTSFTKYQ
jgi:hypothetical protein